jgi:transposase InsO family protein
MAEYQKHGSIEKAALRAGMHRNTASKYLKTKRLPSETKRPRTWRTRPDPFEQDWPEVVARLEVAPELETKTLFEDLRRRYPERYEAGQLRTLQRRVKQWRAQHGPEKAILFRQEHRPGEAMQTDFTWANALGVTIAGEAFPHLLCHAVLPYSNWSWVSVCQSESMLALRRGVQAAVFELGCTPRYHQTDNSTAATHDLRTGKRGFNAEYESLMRHLGMEPRTIQVGEKHQNGDVESLNGALKRRLEQHLLLRWSRDFPSQEAYVDWLVEIQRRANGQRNKRLREELAVMRPLKVKPLREWSEQTVRVTTCSTINLKGYRYSVPSSLIGEQVQVRLWEERVEVLYCGEVMLEAQRLRGQRKHRIDYRHVIWSLVKKPGAFARYSYREEMFPTLVFRRAYDCLAAKLAQHQADREYLRVLHLAAATMQSEVERVLVDLLEADETPCFERVRSFVSTTPPPATPALPPFEVELGEYDALLGVAS